MYPYYKMESSQAVAPEAKKEKVRTFTHFNNYLFMRG